MDNARLDLVEGSVRVASSVDAQVVLVEGFEVIEETLRETHGSADYHDQLVCDTGEGSTRVEQDYGRETFDRRVAGNASLCFAGFQWREFGRVGGGGRVEDPRSGVNVDNVVEALSPADEPVWVSAHWAMAPDMVRLIAAAMVLLSVFLRPGV